MSLEEAWGVGKEDLVLHGKATPYFSEPLCNVVDTQVESKKNPCGERDVVMTEFNIPGLVYSDRSVDNPSEGVPD